MSMRFCGWKFDDGSKCGLPHDEKGAYCAEHRREYQRNYRNGITLKGGTSAEPAQNCRYCNKEMRTNAYAHVGADHCRSCKSVLEYLKRMPASGRKAIFDAAAPRMVEVSDEDIALMLEQ